LNGIQMGARRRISNKLASLLLGMLPEEAKRRLAVHLGVVDIHWSLKQLREFGFIPRNIIDVGAFRGDWTRICCEIFPGAMITCVEPQEACQKELRELVDERPNVRVCQTLLGRSEQEDIPFEDIGSGSSILLSRESRTRRRMTTIDRLVENGVCEAPEFLKLDVQGYEIEVLEGYRRNFDSCQVIECEISLLPLIQGAPLLMDVVNYLARRGFVMFDIDELIRAPSDGAVWQIDVIFCRINSPLRKNRIWRHFPS